MKTKTIASLHFITLDDYRVSHTQQVINACNAGVRWVQLRMKSADKAQILRTALEVREICTHYQSQLIINDYWDIALQAKADGVHLGSKDMPLAEVGRLAGKDFIIGGTANTFNDALQRINQGADYLGIGPYSFTETKKNLSPILGPMGIQRIANQLRSNGKAIPIIAIGGIGLDDLPVLTNISIQGIAVSAAIAKANTQEKNTIVQKIHYAFNQNHLQQLTKGNHAKNCP